MSSATDLIFYINARTSGEAVSTGAEPGVLKLAHIPLPSTIAF